jgi:hypothetical protein
MGVMYQMRPRWAARPLFSRKFPYLSGECKINHAEPVVHHALTVCVLPLVTG